MNKLTIQKIIIITLILITKPIFAQNNGQGNAAWKANGNTPTTGNFIGAVNYMPLLFKTNNLERMRITKDGFVGIGIVAPTVKLDVVGNFKLSGNADIGGDLSLGGTLKVDSIESKTPNGDLTIKSNTLFRDNIYVRNRIGVGTVLPIVALDVVGDANISKNGYFGNNLRVINQLYTDNIGAQTTGGNVTFHDDALFNRNLSVVRNTGLGVLNPTQRLEVDGNITLTGSSYVGNTLFTNKISPNSGTSIMTTAGVNYYTGNIGVGVITPTERLEVDGNIKTTGQFQTDIGILYPDGTAQITAYDPTATVEAAQLEVDSYIKLDNSLFLVAPNTNTSGAIASTDYELYTNDAKNIYFQSKATSGSIIIGKEKITTGDHTDFKLAVDGKAVFKRVIVTVDNWADYVFEKEYKLESLDNVKKYIDENGHLPNVPNEEEVKNNGIDVAEMNAILLRKIEELTLYMIQISEENKTLKEDITILKK